MNAINSRNAARLNDRRSAARRLGHSPAASRPTFGRLVQAGAVVGLSLASAACSSVAPPTQPVAPVSTGAAVCHPTSAAKVLARRVFVPGGVQASEQDGAFSVRFAADRSHCAAVDFASGTQHAEPGSCAAPAARAASRADDADETMLAWESHDAPEPHIALGAVTYDAPRAFFGFGIAGDRRVVAHRFHVPASNAAGGETAPQLAAIGHDRFLLAWVDGDTESHHLRVQSVVGWGEPLGASMVLSPADASVIGRPSVVVAPTGYGLVTYVASIEGEFDVFATPISCAMN
jgi:hypothetical protein